MEFLNCTMDSPTDYKEFILSHDSVKKTEKAAWMEVWKSGKKVIPYCSSCPEEKLEHESIVYFEFVDADLNIYVDFFNRDTEEWIESFCFKDDKFSWTILVDNAMYGDPLGLNKKEDSK